MKNNPALHFIQTLDRIIELVPEGEPLRTALADFKGHLFLVLPEDVPRYWRQLGVVLQRNLPARVENWIGDVVIEWQRSTSAMDQSKDEPDYFKPGLYRHYRGQLYRALFLATHHETEKQFVVYVPLEYPKTGVRVRELDDWNHELQGPERTQEHRFEWVGP